MTNRPAHVAAFAAAHAQELHLRRPFDRLHVDPDIARLAALAARLAGLAQAENLGEAGAVLPSRVELHLSRVDAMRCTTLGWERCRRRGAVASACDQHRRGRPAHRVGVRAQEAQLDGAARHTTQPEADGGRLRPLVNPAGARLSPASSPRRHFGSSSAQQYSGLGTGLSAAPEVNARCRSAA